MCMELNALEKPTNKSVASRFLHELLQRFDGLFEFVMLWINFFENRFDFLEEFS